MKVPRGSKGRPGGQDVVLGDPMGSLGWFDGSSDDLYFLGIFIYDLYFLVGGSRVVHEALADLKKSKIFLAGLFILYVKMSS